MAIWTISFSMDGSEEWSKKKSFATKKEAKAWAVDFFRGYEEADDAEYRLDLYNETTGELLPYENF